MGPTPRLVIPEDIVAPDQMTLSANNGSTKSVSLVVNGSLVREILPGVQVTLAARDLPELPWQAEVRLEGGRTLLSLTVRAGDVVKGASPSGDATRIDLSCGRIDLWSGPPIGGPAPGAGVPGDCNP